MFPRRPPASLAAWLAGARGGGLLGLLANQCRFVTGLRVRRAQQIAQLYGRLYSDSSRCVLLGRLWRRLRGRPGHASALMAALAGVFVWDEERIQEEELQRSINEMKRLEEMSNVFQSSAVERHPPESKSQTSGNEDSKDKEEQPWEMVMDKKHFKLWRRPIAGTHLYQYRGEPGVTAFQVCSTVAPAHRTSVAHTSGFSKLFSLLFLFPQKTDVTVSSLLLIIS